MGFYSQQHIRLTDAGCPAAAAVQRPSQLFFFLVKMGKQRKCASKGQRITSWLNLLSPGFIYFLGSIRLSFPDKDPRVQGKYGSGNRESRLLGNDQSHK